MELSGLNINLQGFDSKSTQIFNRFFEEQCKKQFILSDHIDDADIIIVDIDTYKSSKIVDELLIKQPNTPIIVISLFIYCHTDPIVFAFKKPFIATEFYNLLLQVTLVSNKNTSPVLELRKALLDHIQNNLTKTQKNIKKETNINYSTTALSPIDKSKIATLVGRQADINIDNPQAVMRILFDTKNLLVGSIQRGISRAKHSNKMLELSNFGHRFIIDPNTNTLFTFVSESILRPLCLMTTDEVSSIKLIKNGRDSEVFDALTGDTSVEVTEWSFEEILWKMTLWSARGKLPRDTNLHLPVKLNHWPNFTRLQVFPHALEIAAAMSRAPARLTDIASLLGIEQRFVFAFYSAANAIGIANNSTMQSDSLFQNEVSDGSAREKSQNVQPVSAVKKMFNLLTKGKYQNNNASGKQQGVR